MLSINGEAGPAWGTGITGSADKAGDNPKLRPSSWGGWETRWVWVPYPQPYPWLNTGEHGVSEPASRDENGGEAKRKTAAVTFVFDKYKKYLSTWYEKCWCCCPASKE